MTEFLCTSCGTPACLVLSVRSALPSCSTVLADSTQRLQQELEFVGATWSRARFCIACGNALPLRSELLPLQQPTDPLTAARLEERGTAALHPEPGTLPAPAAMVSVATMHAAMLILARQHHAEMMMLQQELAQLKGVLATALERRPSLRQPERTPARASDPAHHTGDAPSLDFDEGNNALSSRSGSRVSSGHSRSRSPSIVIPMYGAGRPETPPTAVGGALLGTPGSVSIPLQRPAPPRCSRTLPRHSCSYDSDIALPAHAVSADAALSTRRGARSSSVLSASLLHDKLRASAPPTQQELLPIGMRWRWSEDHEHNRHLRQHDENARLREALLQRL
ncbi:hypothetical protein LSCM1_07360 [Leishmania martiniquensis]|uniref:Uncharacterized protein n=1 Tax=Leishmania martiniquensis TaxID=1580590 RepID=A0A836I1B0_9TRYP|nr:hypothetical protein LSCM1_07360 [Leishmania martiniquensis]